MRWPSHSGVLQRIEQLLHRGSPFCTHLTDPELSMLLLLIMSDNHHCSSAGNVVCVMIP